MELSSGPEAQPLRTGINPNQPAGISSFNTGGLITHQCRRLLEQSGRSGGCRRIRPTLNAEMIQHLNPSADVSRMLMPAANKAAALHHPLAPNASQADLRAAELMGGG